MNLFTIIIFINLFSLILNAEALFCKNLFNTEQAKSFKIKIDTKEQFSKYIDQAHNKLIEENNIDEIILLVFHISKHGTETLTIEQKYLINKFRQDTSFLRSILQTLSKDPEEIRKFESFVRDFGHLKDMVNINESKQAQEISLKLIKKFKNLNFKKLINEIKPASRKTVKNYFIEIVEITELIMNKKLMTVDELHDVRKNLRNILRYLQAQNEFYTSENGNLIHNQYDTSSVLANMNFLKKINQKLGQVCDDYAAKIIRNELTEKTLVEFPENIKSKIMIFLENRHVELAEQ